MKKITSIILILTIFTGVAISQKRLIKKADAAYRTGEYSAAVEKYEKVLTKLKSRDKRKGRVAYNLAECYRIMDNSRKARRWYQIAIRSKYQNPYSYLYLGDIFRTMGKYDDAKQKYEKFLKLVPESKRAKNGIKSCKLAKELKKNPSRYIVSVIRKINSKESDFSPSFGRSKSEIYFTSTRPSTEGKKNSLITGENFSDIFVVSKDRKGKWSVPTPIEGEVNTEGSEGAAVIINNGSTMYFTKCRQEKSKNLGCKIYKSRKSSEGWGQPEIVELTKDSSINIGHPAISKDELTMYFVSDSLPNQKGKGGKDIWKVTRAKASAQWSKPVNLGNNINTEGDEVFPFLRDDGTLFFASNGHPGMGGYDIFKATNKESVWTVENMGVPINSEKSDYGITFYEDKEFGYFTSTRKQNRDNIYYFTLPSLNFSVKGIVVDERTDEPINDAKVTMRDPNGHEAEVNSATDGTFRFNLEEKTDYSIIAEKKQYFANRVDVSTKGHKKSKVFEVEIRLGKYKDVIEIPNITYLYNDTTLMPASMKSLDKLVDILNVNPKISIELRANTDFRGEEAYNDKLSKGRANSVVAYLKSKGIKATRLTAVGQGERVPRKLDRKTAGKFSFLNSGDVLTEDFINKLEDKDQKEAAHQLNRRTEFSVVSDENDK